jgi:hypothetical protein
VARGRKKIPVVNLDTNERFASTKEAAASIGVSYSGVMNHLRGRAETIKGHRFQYEHLLNKEKE